MSGLDGERVYPFTPEPVEGSPNDAPRAVGGREAHNYWNLPTISLRRGKET